jgi:hypothetical protein
MTMRTTLPTLLLAMLAAISPAAVRSAAADDVNLAVLNGACFLLDGRGGLTRGTGQVFRTEQGTVGICQSPPIAPPEHRGKVTWTYQNTQKRCTLPQGDDFVQTLAWREEVWTTQDPELGRVGIATLVCSIDHDGSSTKHFQKPKLWW